MEYKYNDIKEYLKKKGVKKEVGVANHKCIVYEWYLSELKPYYFSISYDGMKANCNKCHNRFKSIRYNETSDCIQVSVESCNSYHYINTRYKTLKFNENGRMVNQGHEILFFTDPLEAEQYCITFYNSNIAKVKKTISDAIKDAKKSIKHYEKRIKEYTNKLKELE